jgi:hypothetical protein
LPRRRCLLAPLGERFVESCESKITSGLNPQRPK